MWLLFSPYYVLHKINKLSQEDVLWVRLKKQLQRVLPIDLGLITNVINENIIKPTNLNDIPTSPPSSMQENK
jgi:hypothetical protein